MKIRSLKRYEKKLFLLSLNLILLNFFMDLQGSNPLIIKYYTCSFKVETELDTKLSKGSASGAGSGAIENMDAGSVSDTSVTPILGFLWTFLESWGSFLLPKASCDLPSFACTTSWISTRKTSACCRSLEGENSCKSTCFSDERSLSREFTDEVSFFLFGVAFTTTESLLASLAVETSSDFFDLGAWALGNVTSSLEYSENGHGH